MKTKRLYENTTKKLKVNSRKEAIKMSKLNESLILAQDERWRRI